MKQRKKRWTMNWNKSSLVFGILLGIACIHFERVWFGWVFVFIGSILIGCIEEDK
jgi:hypothetical protein